MQKEKIWKLFVLIAIPIIIALIPTPTGLPHIAWLLFGLYLAAIVGLVLKPYSEPVILLATIAASAVIIGAISKILEKEDMHPVRHGLYLLHLL